jgi:thiamine biosynthesis protein ThiS
MEGGPLPGLPSPKTEAIFLCVKITLNFDTETFDEQSLTVSDILARKHWSFPLVIVKINGLVVDRSAYAERVVEDGDEVEAYHLVSGG